ncbi:MAG: hypothetical protein ACREQA_09715 [Candidatus Binatia bacterium]
MIWQKISFEFLGDRVKKRAILCLFLGLVVYPSIAEAQPKVYPHLQIFLVPSQPGERFPFITFWDGFHKLAAGPFPVKLLEREGLSVLLDFSYSKPNEEPPSAARLKIERSDNISSQGRGGLVLMDQLADLIADRGVSKMFPDGPFLVIGHKAPSQGILQLGNIMEEIQRKLLACDKEYRKELDAVLNSLREAPSYERVLKTVESIYPPCPLQRS